MSELGINGASPRLQAMQVRQIRTAPRPSAAAAQAQQPLAPRPTAELGQRVAWAKTTAHAAAVRPTDGQVAGSFNKLSSGLARELQSSADNNAAAFGHIGALQTAFQYALGNSISMMASPALRTLD